MKESTIIFIDNSIQQIYKSIDALKHVYINTLAFNSEVEGVDYVYSHSCDIVFLNLDLFPNDAVTLTKEIQQKELECKPFIVIYSDKQDDFVNELALNSGADSFINFQNKPAVLQLFIKNLLNRRKKEILPSKSIVQIDRERYVILNKGEQVHLPKKEFKLFELLFSNPNKFFTKTEIATEIWNDVAVSNKRIIDVHIYNIRRFFGKRIIQSQKGKGYRFNKNFV